jgi:AAA family ATP:ADP antiporter
MLTHLTMNEADITDRDDAPAPTTTSEWTAIVVAFVCAMCLLATFMMLRPVRDAMGVQGGVKSLPSLFTITFFAMLIATPIFGWLSSRVRRTRLVIAIYALLVSCLLAFYLLMRTETAPREVAMTFFVWHSVFNLFSLSLFWSFMGDVFGPQQAKRFFGYVAAGATTGAIVGPAIANLAPKIGVANLLLIAATTLVIAILGVLFLSRWLARENPEQAQRAPNRPIGGSMLAGLKAVFSSWFMAALAGYFLLFTMIQTFLYLEQAGLVASLGTPEERVEFFARVDFFAQLFALALQVLVTRFVVSKLGFMGTLFILPIVTLLAIVTIIGWPTLNVIGAAQAVRRATDYALARPAREALFTLVSREDRYKTKNFIDTTVYRGGDVIAGWLDYGIKAASLGASVIAILAIPCAIAWIGLVAGLRLAARRTLGRT